MKNVVQQVVSIHAVDNIKLSKDNIALLDAIQRKEMTPQEAKKIALWKVLNRG